MSEFFRVKNVSLARVYIVPIPNLKVAAAVKRLMSLVNVFLIEWEHDEGLTVIYKRNVDDYIDLQDCRPYTSLYNKIVEYTYYYLTILQAFFYKTENIEIHAEMDLSSSLPLIISWRNVYE